MTGWVTSTSSSLRGPITCTSVHTFFPFCLRLFFVSIDDCHSFVEMRYLLLKGKRSVTRIRLWYQIAKKQRSYVIVKSKTSLRPGIFFLNHWRTFYGAIGTYPCSGLLVMSTVGFQRQGGSLTCVLALLHVMDSSDSSLVWHLLSSWCPVL